jgi:hypothetical protein
MQRHLAHGKHASARTHTQPTNTNTHKHTSHTNTHKHNTHTHTYTHTYTHTHTHTHTHTQRLSRHSHKSGQATKRRWDAAGQTVALQVQPSAGREQSSAKARTSSVQPPQLAAHSTENHWHIKTRTPHWRSTHCRAVRLPNVDGTLPAS